MIEYCCGLTDMGDNYRNNDLKFYNLYLSSVPQRARKYFHEGLSAYRIKNKNQIIDDWNWRVIIRLHNWFGTLLSHFSLTPDLNGVLHWISINLHLNSGICTLGEEITTAEFKTSYSISFLTNASVMKFLHWMRGDLHLDRSIFTLNQWSFTPK